MSFFNKKRADKRKAENPQDDWNEQIRAIQKQRREDPPQAKPLLSQKRATVALNTGSQTPLPKKILSLKRTVSDARGTNYGGGYKGGEDKESVRTIGGGETRGEEISAPLPTVLETLVRKANISFRRKQERESRRPVPAPKIDRLWFNIVIQHFPRAVPPLWDAKHRGLSKHLTTRIGAEQVVAFVKWSVENWGAVIRTKFAWMNKSQPPLTPDFSFLVKFVHVFTEAREASKDTPLEVTALVKGLNVTKKTTERRESNTPPISPNKPILLKRDLSPTVSIVKPLPDWRD